jgi:hypothetical protein
MKLFRTKRLSKASLALLLALGVGAFVVAPQGTVPFAYALTSDEAVAQMIDLNKKAIAAYRGKQHQAALDGLLAAKKLGDESGLSDHDMMARTYIHMGIVAISGLKDRGNGLEYLARALQMRPKIKLTPTLATASLKRDMRIARDKVVKLLPPRSAPAPVAAAPEAAKPKEAAAVAKASAPEAKVSGDPNVPPMPQAVPQPLYCPTPDVGPPNQPVPLFCLTQPDVRAGKVVAFFRPAGGEDYTAVPMNRSKSGWLQATVPARAVVGRTLQVYFEAQDTSGNVAANNGKDELPNVIQLKPGAPQISPRKLAYIEVGEPPPARQDESAEATPLELREKAEEAAAADALLPKGRPRRAAGSIFVGLGVGSGYGWHRELPLERHAGRQVTAGFSPAGMGHISPELGYQWTSRLALSLQTRHQYIPSSGSGDAEVTSAPPELAHAVLLRLQYALFDLGDLQVLGSLAAGGGSALRMHIAPNRRAGLAASDTVVAGPVAGGVGLGFAYNFTPHVIAALEARALAGAPAFAVLMEGTAGLQIAF